MRTAQQTHEGPWCSYLDLQQSQCKTLILLGNSSTVLPRKGFQKPVPFFREPCSCPPRAFLRLSRTRAWEHHQYQRSHCEPWESSCCAYIPDEYVPQMLNSDDTGQKLYEDYVSQKINGDVSLWARVKRRKQPDVHFWQHSGQNCGSKGNQRFVWTLDGFCSFEQRH